MENKSYTAERLPCGGFKIEDNGVRAFLFEGKDAALLIDTGFGGALKELADTLTDKPIALLNTHADRDHIGANDDFGPAHMHPAEFALYHSQKPGLAVVPVWDGDTIDIGDRSFEVIHIPGHTPGSIAILCNETRTLIAGDSISCAPIFMFGPARDFDAYIASLNKLRVKYADRFDRIAPSHGEFELPADIIDKLINAAALLMSGKLKAYDPEIDIPAKLYKSGDVGFFCP